MGSVALAWTSWYPEQRLRLRLLRVGTLLGLLAAINTRQ